MREEKQRKEEEEKEAQKRAEEEERRRWEEEEKARLRAEREEERRRLENEKARIKAAAEAKARAEKEEMDRMAEKAEKKLVKEPQTREDPDIELITEEMLDDNLTVLEMEEEVNTSTHREDKHVKGEELNDMEMDLEVNSIPAEAGPQLEERDEEDDFESGTPAESDSTFVLSSDGVFALRPSTAEDKSHNKTSIPSNTDQNRAKSTADSKGQLSRSQEKRELRRQRGLEHNQRETERASSSVSGKDETSSPKNKTQATRLKERSESKELDQYTFVAWKMKEDKAAKKETKTSPPPAGPVRPSTLPLQPVSDRNGVSEGTGAVGLQRRPGAIKEKPEKWRGRKSDGDLFERTSPPQPHSREERRTKTPLYVFFQTHLHFFINISIDRCSERHKNSCVLPHFYCLLVYPQS